MEKYFIRFTKTSIIILFIVFFLLFNLGFIVIFNQLDAGILDGQLFYTADKAYQVIGSYGHTGRETYIRGTLALDFIYPLVYSVMLSLLLFKATKDQILSSLPFVILLLDYFENITLLTVVFNFPERIDSVATIAGFITLLKWFMVAASVLLLSFVSLKSYFFKHNNPC